MDSDKEILLDMSDYRPHGNIKVIEVYDAVQRIIRKTGFNIFNYREVFNDKKTKSLISEGRTIGCFYIESPGMRSLLKRTNCTTFEMLTAVSSIIRPGVAESGMMKEFIERHKYPAKRKYLIPEMEKYLSDTYGVMIYQEDVIKVAYHVVGLTLDEADFLRRAMSGKMRSHKAMQLINDKFFDGCKSRGYSVFVSQSLWKQIESFAGYAFCKAHSASFGILSFQVAYLKAHFPATFMAGVLNNGGGYYSAAVYVTEAVRMGIKILLPDINQSRYNYIGFDSQIRIGFLAIKNFEKSFADVIVSERKRNGNYSSLIDYLSRTKLGYESTESLIKCGAMDCFGLTRPTLLRLLALYFKRKTIIESHSDNLFANDFSKLEMDIVTDIDFSIEERCIYEYELFGYMVSGHPLQFFFSETKDMKIINASEMNKYHNRKIKMIGWFMTSKRIKTSKGELMKFLSLEDLTGTYEAVIFPESYKKFGDLTLSMGPYIIEGKVDAISGNNIIVEKLEVLNTTRARAITQKDRNDTQFFGDPDTSVTNDEIRLVNTLGRQKLYTALVG